MKPKSIKNRPLTDAERTIAATCIGFAYKQAITVGSRRRLQSADIDDLMQEAALGVMRAAKDYDSRVAKFTTYSGVWIRAYISYFLATPGVVALPKNMAHLRRKYDGINPKTGKAYPDPVHPAGGSVSSGEHDYIANIPSPVEDDPVEYGELLAILTDLLSCLNEEQRTVITLRYSLQGRRAILEDMRQAWIVLGGTDYRIAKVEEYLQHEYPLSQPQIGVLLGHKPRQRIEQIERKAMKKLREQFGVPDAEVEEGKPTTASKPPPPKQVNTPEPRKAKKC